MKIASPRGEVAASFSEQTEGLSKHMKLWEEKRGSLF